MHGVIKKLVIGPVMAVNAEDISLLLTQEISKSKASQSPEMQSN
jgi:hypothetical protein